jgi:predicted MFS family arabinose efflux permease
MDVWVVIGASAMTAIFGLTTIVIAGTWLDDALGVSTGGIGLVAMAFGAAELLASSSSSAFADALGKRRSMIFSVSCALIGMAVISQAGSSLLIGAIGLVLFFLGFEYSIVTSFSLVSEAMPHARGRALGLGNAVGTLGRGAGVMASGFLYEAFGIRGPIAVSAVAAVVTLVFLVAIGRLRPDLR